MADASKPRARPLPAPPGGASGGKAGTGAAAAAAAAAPTTSSSASNSNLSRSRKLIGAPFDQQRKAVIKLQAWYRCVVVRRASLPLAAQMRRRFLIAQEIATSEQSYLANIRVLTGLFLNPLRSALDYTDGAPPITKDEMKSIFSNIEGIQALNFSVLERLQSRLHNWHPYQPIGDIFLKMAPFLKVYTQYCQNYNAAVETFTKVSERPLFKQFLAICCSFPESQGLSFLSLLICPVQRIPRYMLLLNELLRSTPLDHPDYQSTKEATEKISQVTTHINKDIKLSTAIKDLQRIQDDLGMETELLKVNRYLVKEGGFKEFTSKGTRKAWLYLLSDMIIFAAQDVFGFSYRYKGEIPLEGLWVEVQASVDTPVFLLVGPTETLAFLCSSHKELDDWVSSITVAVQLHEQSIVRPTAAAGTPAATTATITTTTAAAAGTPAIPRNAKRISSKVEQQIFKISRVNLAVVNRDSNRESSASTASIAFDRSDSDSDSEDTVRSRSNSSTDDKHLSAGSTSSGGKSPRSGRSSRERPSSAGKCPTPEPEPSPSSSKVTFATEGTSADSPSSAAGAAEESVAPTVFVPPARPPPRPASARHSAAAVVATGTLRKPLPPPPSTLSASTPAMSTTAPDANSDSASASVASATAGDGAAAPALPPRRPLPRPATANLGAQQKHSLSAVQRNIEQASPSNEPTTREPTATAEPSPSPASEHSPSSTDHHHHHHHHHQQQRQSTLPKPPLVAKRPVPAPPGVVSPRAEVPDNSSQAPPPHHHDATAATSSLVSASEPILPSQQPPALASTTLMYEGYLKKKGQVNPQYKKRYFRLTNGALEYYKSRTKGEMTGAVPITKDTAVATAGKSTFNVFSKGRTYTLAAENESECGEWVRCIQNAALLAAELSRTSPPPQADATE